MDFGTSQLTPTTAFFGALALGCLGAIIWWLLRKRQVRVWLPTVRVLDFENRMLPRLLVRPPPWLLFLAFVATSLAVTVMTLRPHVQIMTPADPKQDRAHIFLDMSPSVSAHVTVQGYGQRVRALFDQLKEQGRISVSTSHDGTLYEPTDGAEVEALVLRLGFHRAGARLASLLKDQLAAAGQVDRLFIASDRDQHSWSGFDWSYLTSEMDVLHVDLVDESHTRNIFIGGARYLSPSGSPTMEWTVEVARQARKGAKGKRASDETQVQGVLTATYGGETLARVDWTLAAGAEKADVRAAWPESKMPRDAGVGKSADGELKTPLLWTLSVQDSEANRLELDDTFRVEPRGMRQDVLLISESAGERPLEDPTHQLEIALQVLGFRVKRHDFTTQPGPNPDDFPLWIIVGGAGHGSSAARLDESFCPQSLEQARWQRLQESATSSRTSWPRVWLVPFQLEADYEELCHCYSHLLLSSKDTAAAPPYCEHVQTRAGWIELLPSLGARQIGGELGAGASTLAWLGVERSDTASGDQKSDGRGPAPSVLAFTIPLTPSLATGLTHARLPLLVKDILALQGLLQSSDRTTAWPRYEDTGALLEHNMTESGSGAEGEGRSASRLPPSLALSVRQSNVPIGESLVQTVDVSALPPRWSVQDTLTSRQAATARRDHDDPLPWLRMLVGLVLGAAFVEVVGLMVSRVLSSSRASRKQART